MSQKSYDNTNCLYLIPTPIGNMEDMTLRAINTLKMVDVIFCEDTRITKALLSKFEISKKLISSNKYTEVKNTSLVLNYLKQEKNVAIVTDRGTPIISDPGYKIVQEVIKENFNVISLPGATALIPALVTSGLDSTHFIFYGFLIAKASKRKKELETLKKNPYTIIFYEAPHRILETLGNIYEIFGNRRISVAREISKMYEEIYRGDISDVIAEISSKEIKGEFVIIVEGNKEKTDYAHLSIKTHVNSYLSDGLEEKEALKKVARDRNMSKSDVYREYHIEVEK